MGIYLTSGDPDEKKILSSIADNWQEIDNLSGSSLCFIYFDSSICKAIGSSFLGLEKLEVSINTTYDKLLMILSYSQKKSAKN